MDIKEPYGQLAMPNAYPALLELANKICILNSCCIQIKVANFYFFLILNYGELTGFLKKPWAKNDIWRYTHKNLKIHKNWRNNEPHEAANLWS